LGRGSGRPAPPRSSGRERAADLVGPPVPRDARASRAAGRADDVRAPVRCATCRSCPVVVPLGSPARPRGPGRRAAGDGSGCPSPARRQPQLTASYGTPISVVTSPSVAATVAVPAANAAAREGDVWLACGPAAPAV